MPAEFRFNHKPLSQLVLIFTLVCIYLAPYLFADFFVGWWRFIPACILFLLVSFYFKGSEARTYLGLIWPTRNDMFIGVVLFVIASGFALYVVPVLLAEQGVLANISLPTWERIFITPFHVLMEEMLFRAILVATLIKFWPHPLRVAVVLALLFSLAHQINYYTLQNEAFLSASALVSLFNLGLALNLFYLKSKSIFLPLVIHMSWNFFRFKPKWHYAISGSPVSEGASFNLIEGHMYVLGLSLFLLLVSILYYKKNASLIYQE